MSETNQTSNIGQHNFIASSGMASEISKMPNHVQPMKLPPLDLAQTRDASTGPQTNSFIGDEKVHSAHNETQTKVKYTDIKIASPLASPNRQGL